ncbi:hypothetical protein [Methanomassiliicoccus luminyensis]|uniref:hypothetical protein n=1 Tax=Methanomassiliicoccus luminyensis TaxID=1080712 RepID=UPI00036FCE30|nr:hypothetical protein [Methanomassiliicoccus luminyensis]
MNTKIIAVILVVVLAGTGVGAYLLMNQGSATLAKVDAPLSIYGNADNDYKIDEDDVSTVEKIISGELKANEYPLADANYDGAVDSKDVDHLRDMIDKKKGITVYVFDASGATVGIEYPLEHIVPVGTNLISTIIQIGGAQTVVGYTKTNYGVAHSPILNNAVQLGGGIFDLDTDDSINAFKNLDASIDGGIDAVVTQNSDSYLKKSASFLEGAEVTILRFDTAEGLSSIDGALTIGYLLGEDCEKQAINYALMSYEILDEIKEKLKEVDPADVKTSFSVTMGYYVARIDSDYTGLTALAGSPTVCTLEGDGSAKMDQGDEYYKAWNADYIVSYRTLDYSIDYLDMTKGKTMTPVDTWKAYMTYFDELDCYENLIYINSSIPVVCRIAYLAEVFYPEIFGDGYGDSVHQEFVDTFMSYLGDDFDVSQDMTTLITYDMVKDSL